MTYRVAHKKKWEIFLYYCTTYKTLHDQVFMFRWL